MTKLNLQHNKVDGMTIVYQPHSSKRKRLESLISQTKVTRLHITRQLMNLEKVFVLRLGHCQEVAFFIIN
ncbi:CLUMA_CG015545, isoform A [Clunio marinus]|uniref:CLUMA_CG015545, isoform A n=1 Tax=Clunio marinus TaxID=568069 RepID=A0A1J1IQ18_9DIPT|nr:CLUMA_CG015545, isoform A [Clunio marinus]